MKRKAVVRINPLERFNVRFHRKIRQGSGNDYFQHPARYYPCPDDSRKTLVKFEQLDSFNPRPSPFPEALNHSLADCRRALTSGGSYVLIGYDPYGNGMRRWVGLLTRMFKLMALSLFVSQLRDMRFSMPDKKASMDFLRPLLESGKLTPPIDKTDPLSEVPEALRDLLAGHAKEKVVIIV